VDVLEHINFDYIVTACDKAHQACPFYPARTKVVHAGFDDPPNPAAGASTEEDAMSHYRRVRDEIKQFALVIERLPEPLISDTAEEK